MQKMEAGEIPNFLIAMRREDGVPDTFVKVI